MLIETLRPLHIRRATGDLHLRPGVPVELPDDEAAKLLQKVPDKVRVVTGTGVTVEPAITPDGFLLRPVYWERWDGSIVGPARPEFFFQDSSGQVGLILSFQGETVAVAEFMLRSKRAFDTQVRLREVEPIRF